MCLSDSVNNNAQPKPKLSIVYRSPPKINSIMWRHASILRRFYRQKLVVCTIPNPTLNMQVPLRSKCQSDNPKSERCCICRTAAWFTSAPQLSTRADWRCFSKRLAYPPTLQETSQALHTRWLDGATNMADYRLDTETPFCYPFFLVFFVKVG